MQKLTYSQILFQSGAISFNVANPFTFTSGLRSPIYLDNRQVPGWPHLFKDALGLLAELVQEKVGEGNIDVICGVVSSGVPWATGLGMELDLPSNWAKPEAKEHGKKSAIQGLEVKGRSVLVLEDHFSTGRSSAEIVEAIRAAGGFVRYVVSLTTYETALATETFTNLGVIPYSLVTGREIVQEARAEGLLTADDEAEVLEWFRNPQEWSAKRGGVLT